MKVSAMGLCLVLALGRTAAAQVAATEPTSAVDFEQQLTEELAARGIVLARQHLELRIEPRGERCSVSLVDLTTDRPAAATEIDRLPANPDDAIALLVRAVIALDAARDPPRSAEPQATTPQPGASSTLQPALPARRRSAPELFRRRSLRFARSHDLGAQPDRELGDHWRVFRGGLDEELDPPAFYRLVGRDDLARAYQRRQALMIGGLVVSGVAFGVAVAMHYRGDDLESCTVQPNYFDQCAHTETHTQVPAIVAAGVGVVGGVVSTYFFRNPHPVDEDEAKTLADAYNQHLRGQLGLPVARSEPLVRELALAPYVEGASRGFVLAGRF